MTVAIALWNTVYLARAAQALRDHGLAVGNALLPHLSPLGWEHINLTGNYLWRSCGTPGAGKFRPSDREPPILCVRFFPFPERAP